MHATKKEKNSPEECIVDRRHAETSHLLGMAGEVSNVLVIVEGEISNRIVHLRTGVNGCVVCMGPSRIGIMKIFDQQAVKRDEK